MIGDRGTVPTVLGPEIQRYEADTVSQNPPIKRRLPKALSVMFWKEKAMLFRFKA